jgi:orotidine 5'-phosphate decarboxylase subfamily 2
VRAVPPEIPVIADAKRGDIASTAEAYARALFDHLGCDACTLSPYLGIDAITPFLDRPGRFVFVLCRTSNPSAAELQDVAVDGATLNERVARTVYGWERPNRCGLVVGATDPAAAARAAAAAPGLWLLAPGLGAQSGDLTATAHALGTTVHSTIWNASRAITGSGNGRDFAQRARDAAAALRRQINQSYQPSAISHQPFTNSLL